MEKLKRSLWGGIGASSVLIVAALSIALGAGCSEDSDSDKSADEVTATDGGAATDAESPVDSGTSAGEDPVTADLRPVVFVHGGFGSATQFESQAQRLMTNGYPLNYLAAYEHNTGPGAPDPADQIDRLDEIIDAVLDETGADQVELIAHSRGGGVCFHYLESSAERAEKVAHYVVVDSGTGLSLTTGMDRTPGNVDTLALWGEGDPTREVVGATNTYIPEQAHIEMATAAASFAEMYEFFNGEAPRTTDIEEAEGDELEIAGRVNYFPENTGALGTLRIYEVDVDTGFRTGDDPEPVGEWDVDESGNWGPATVKKGAAYEFAFDHDSGAKHYIYREPFFADNYFVHLLTSPPGGFLAVLLTRSPNHLDAVVMRDKEIWGDQGDDSDILMVDGTNVATELAAARENRLSGLFLLDWGPGAHPDLEDTSTVDYGDSELGESDLDEPLASFHGLPFMSGLDLYIPAASPPDRTVEFRLTPRGGDGAEQVINIPNWASEEVRTSVVFRDFVQ